MRFTFIVWPIFYTWVLMFNRKSKMPPGFTSIAWLIRSTIFITHPDAGSFTDHSMEKQIDLVFLLFNVKQKVSSQILSKVEHRRKCKQKHSTEQVELQLNYIPACLPFWQTDVVPDAMRYNFYYLTLYSWIEVWNCFSSITYYHYFHVSSYSTHQFEHTSWGQGWKLHHFEHSWESHHKPWLFSRQSHVRTLTHHTCTSE